METEEVKDDEGIEVKEKKSKKTGSELGFELNVG